MKPSILYEDNHLLVVVKPFNVPSQPDRSQDMDMLTFYKEYLKQTYDKPGEAYLGLVHRLDRPAGGVMDFAKTSKAAARLSAQLQAQTFQKTYLLCCEKAPQPVSGLLEDTLLKGPDEMVRVVSPDVPGGKAASLSYQTLTVYPNGHALCRVSLHTGRSHQIRVQFAHRGWPLLGDARYGHGGRQLCLWAASLTLVHPTQKQPMTFTAPVPKGLWEE